MAPLDIKLEYQDSSIAGVLVSQLATILVDFVCTDAPSEVDATARSLMALIPANRQYSQPMFDLSNIIVELAEQIPYYHASHSKLARLLVFLQESPKFISTSTLKGEEELQHSYQSLKEAIRDNFDGPDGDEFPAIEWVNFNSFLAHVAAMGVWISSGPTYPIWELRDALETSPAPEDEPLQEYRIMAAAQWILWYGQQLFQIILQPPAVSPDRARAWQFGSLYNGEGEVLSVNRWRFWKKGFAAFAEGQDGSDEARRLALKASNLMDALENSMM